MGESTPILAVPTARSLVSMQRPKRQKEKRTTTNSRTLVPLFWQFWRNRTDDVHVHLLPEKRQWHADHAPLTNRHLISVPKQEKRTTTIPWSVVPLFRQFWRNHVNNVHAHLSPEKRPCRTDLARSSQEKRRRHADHAPSNNRHLFFRTQVTEEDDNQSLDRPAAVSANLENQARKHWSRTSTTSVTCFTSHHPSSPTQFDHAPESWMNLLHRDYQRWHAMCGDRIPLALEKTKEDVQELLGKHDMERKKHDQQKPSPSDKTSSAAIVVNYEDADWTESESEQEPKAHQRPPTPPLSADQFNQFIDALPNCVSFNLSFLENHTEGLQMGCYCPCSKSVNQIVAWREQHNLEATTENADLCRHTKQKGHVALMQHVDGVGKQASVLDLHCIVGRYAYCMSSTDDQRK